MSLPSQLTSKLCVLRVHDEKTSIDHVIFNKDHFEELGLVLGDLIEISAIQFDTNSNIRDFQPENDRHDDGRPDPDKPQSQPTSQWKRRASNSSLDVPHLSETSAPFTPGSEHVSPYTYRVEELSVDLKNRFKDVPLSISQTVAQNFGFRRGMQVKLTRTDETYNAASFVEIAFKDEYLSRADMWRLAVSELSDTMVYREQKVLFLGTIKGTVSAIWIDGKRTRHGFFNGSTRPIFRSESARFTIFIQISREMQDFDVEGSGEIMFDKVINGFLPELFKNWESINARHLVSIVMFARLRYYDNQSAHVSSQPRDGISSTAEEPEDFYRVVVSDMASVDWRQILYQLKKEFKTFIEDISVRPMTKAEQIFEEGTANKQVKYAIVGEPSVAAEGNILEALQLASTQFSRDYIDRDLIRTGISVVVITAGTGVFNVDAGMLKLTTDTLISGGIGVDLVCLSPMPLHSVPLFQYKTPRGHQNVFQSVDQPSGLRKDWHGRPLSIRSSKFGSSTPKVSGNLGRGQAMDGWSYVIPHWIDASFWRGSSSDQTQNYRNSEESRSRADGAPGVSNHAFSIRCRMYELQMMGVMENEMTNIRITVLQDERMTSSHSPLHVNQIDDSDSGEGWQDDYDENAFSSLKVRAQNKAEGLSYSSESETKTVSAQSDLMQESLSKGYGSISRSPVFRPAAGYLDWKLKDESQAAPLTPPTLKGRPSHLSLTSTAESGRLRRLGMPRQMSFGIKSGAGTASVTMASASRVLEVGGDFNRSGSSNLAQQFRAALHKTTPRATATDPFAHQPSDKKAKVITRPIDIGTKIIRTQQEKSSTNIDPDATLKESKFRKPDNGSHHASPDNLISTSAITFAASTTRGLGRKPEVLSSSFDPKRSIHGPSPRTTLSPWLIPVNPCNPHKNVPDTAGQFRRWQHVFPKQLRTTQIKWKSLCSPASVPLTIEYFPTPAELDRDFEESVYRLSPNTDDDVAERPRSRDALMRELIGFRFAHGYQLIVGSALSEFLGAAQNNLIATFDEGTIAKDGATVFMIVGGAIHQLTCTYEDDIEVRRYNRRHTAATSLMSDTIATTYKPYIRTLLDTGYKVKEIAFKTPRSEYNWNYIDRYLAGQEDFSEALKFWRARFLLVPIDLPSQKGRGMPVVTEDSAEEIRLEGIRKLTQVWQRHRVLPPDERNYQSHQRRKDPNPLAIEYQTRDPSAVIAAGLDNHSLSEHEAALSTSIFAEDDTFVIKNVDLHRLAQNIQGEEGIKISDRRWHFKLYYSCFVGLDLTSWLVQKFRDIETREDAVNFGNELMKQGLFQHVSSRHTFRDGQYFYTISPEHRVARPDMKSSWFSTKRFDRSVPSTPMRETMPRHPAMEKVPHSRPDTATSSEPEPDTTPSLKPADSRRTVTLSHVMKYDVDFRHKSYRPEIINLHYDRLHNPDNCYHIRIDWMNVTAKFIEDAISSWAATIDRYGLRLVEVPIAEAAEMAAQHPFRAPYIIKLAREPPAATLTQYLDASSFTPHNHTDRFFYQKAVLRKLQFILDLESASSFPSDVDVVFSWGKPDYQMTQYIHKSGMVLAQITEEGHFLLLANRLYNNRAHVSRESLRDETQHDRRPHTAQTLLQQSQTSRRSPMSSPISRPLQAPDQMWQNASTMFTTQGAQQTPEDIKDIVEAFCSDAEGLKTFYDEVAESRKTSAASPSPRVVASSAHSSDLSIPSMRLPPMRYEQGKPRSSPLSIKRSEESASDREENILEGA